MIEHNGEKFNVGAHLDIRDLDGKFELFVPSRLLCHACE